MSTSDDRAARLSHLRREALAKGDPLALPLVMTSVYNLPGDPAGHHQYGRYDNPTWEALEHALSILEDAPCIAFPSGMAAISAVFCSLLKTGDRVLLPADGYYTTRVFAERFLKPMGISFEARPARSFADGGFDGYRLVFVETPSNPGLDICDIAGISGQAHAAGAIVVADNTTMTPFGQRPLELGDWRKLSGSIPGPFEAWQVHRGLETLELRFDRMCSSAETIAPRLAAHQAVKAVVYPGLEDHPSHNLARRQMMRFGSLIGLTLASAEAAERFIDGCALLAPATSFGGVHSSAERRARWGDAVAPGFVRLSIGCEPAEDLWRAFERSLDDATT